MTDADTEARDLAQQIAGVSEYHVETAPEFCGDWCLTHEGDCRVVMGAKAIAAALRARETQTVEVAFAHGVLAALHVVFAHDEETLYDEIVGTVGIENLLAACEPGDREMVGLVNYGWAGRHPRKLAPLTPKEGTQND